MDRKDRQPLTSKFLEDLGVILEPRRIAGMDLEIRPPRYISLYIRLRVVVEKGFSQRQVRAAVNHRFHDPAGGFFRSGRFSFGTPVYLSRIVTAVMEIHGVARVEPLAFQRWGVPPDGELDSGVIEPGPLGIARVESDPYQPQNVSIAFQMEGGLL